MAIKLPIKKHNLVFIAFAIFFVVVVGILINLNMNASARFAESKAQHQNMVNAENRTASLLLRLKECAHQNNSKKFASVHTELSVKFFKNEHSVDPFDVEPALIECKRLAYK